VQRLCLTCSGAGMLMADAGSTAFVQVLGLLTEVDTPKLVAADCAVCISSVSHFPYYAKLSFKAWPVSNKLSQPHSLSMPGGCGTAPCCKALQAHSPFAASSQGLYSQGWRCFAADQLARQQQEVAGHRQSVPHWHAVLLMSCLSCSSRTVTCTWLLILTLALAGHCCNML
jgi:hypothetical protein